MASENKEILLINALQQYAARQGKYIKYFRRGDLDKLPEWTEDARWSLNSFKQLFHESPLAEIAAERRHDIVTVFELIGRQEKELKKLASHQFQHMAVQIPRLRRGKMALHGYLNQSTRSTRFLSSSG
jgi:hypothetical protein